jgi:putative molybdopterin biosynthesis protein
MALGRVTTEPVVARWPSPRLSCAAMDGIAVLASAVPADREVRLPAGTFEWIDTGDPMPDGADTVVVRERLLPQGDGSVIVTAADGHARPNVRAAGEDFQAGEVLVPAGQRLRPGDLAAAAAGGRLTLTVARQPVVAVIPTGDEIRPVGSPLRRGEIADTNSLMVAARCRQLGAVPVVSGVVPDDPDALATEIRRCAHEADLVLVIAGSSRGRGDHASAVLAQVGGVAVAGVAVRPGHPALLGHAKRGPGARGGVAPVIGLPGYPLATAVIFELFAVPLLASLQGWRRDEGTVRAVLDTDWSSPEDLEDWVPVTLARDADGTPRATPGRHGAGSLSQLSRAAAWWPIPAGLGHFPANAVIEIRPISADG